MARQDLLDLYRDQTLSFDEFIESDNAELLAHLRGLKHASGHQLFFLWGGAAVGKSHLLQALCADFHAAGKTSVYLPLALPALQPQVLQGMEQADLVCLDDMQAHRGDSAWEHEIFHLFNQVRDCQGVLLLAARAAPRQLNFELADLNSRLSWGLAYPVHPVAEEQRADYLLQQGKHRGMEFSEQVLSYILNHSNRDMASLLDFVQQLDQASLEQQRRITVPFVKQLLSKCKAE